MVGNGNKIAVIDTETDQIIWRNHPTWAMQDRHLLMLW